MAQRKGAVAKGKKTTNGTSKPVKNAKLNIDEVVAAAQKQPKKNKQPVQQVEQSDDDSDASEAGNGINFDDGSDSESEDAAADNLIDSQSEEEDSSEEESSDDDDDQESESASIESGELSFASKNANSKPITNDDDELDSYDDDVVPVEAPNFKQKPAPAKKGGIPEIRVGKIPDETPRDQIVFVTNLPQDYKHLDLVEVFAKFGPIAIVDRIKSKAGQNVRIAFKTASGAGAAIGANPKALVLNGQQLQVSLPFDKSERNTRTVFVGLIAPGTTDQQLRAHFQKCGPIETINITHNRKKPMGYVRFQTLDSVAHALKLNWSVLDGRIITVNDQSIKAPKVPERTIIVKNTEKHEFYNGNAIEKIFKKCGDLELVDVVCTDSLLAFVCFKKEESVAKALQLNGQTVGDLTLTLTPFSAKPNSHSILVTNLPQEVPVDELKAVFAKSGEIEDIKAIRHKAIIKFSSEEGFCKSFLQNEVKVGGQPIFIQPNSTLKHKILKNKTFVQGKKPFNKRPAQDNGSAPRFQKRPKHSFDTSKAQYAPFRADVRRN